MKTFSQVFIFLCLFCSCIQLNAQNIVWQKCYGGSAVEQFPTIVAAANNEFYIAASSQSNDGDVHGNLGNADFFVAKINGAGDTLWTRTYGGSGEDICRSAVLNWEGGLILTGYTQSNDGDVSGNHGSTDFWVLNLDGSGNILWQKCFGGQNIERGYSVVQSPDSCYILAGTAVQLSGDVPCDAPMMSMNAGWYFKIDRTGNILWNQCLPIPSMSFNEVYAARTLDGGVILSGSYLYSLTELRPFVWKRKSDLSGDWGLSYWPDAMPPRAQFYRGVVMGDSSFVFAGTYENGWQTGDFDLWFLRLGPTGDTMAVSTIGTAAKLDWGTDIIATGNGFAMAGRTNSVGNFTGENFWFLQTDLNGNVIRQGGYGGSYSDKARSLCKTQDGFLLAGTTGSINGQVSGNHGNDDIWVIKLDTLPPSGITEEVYSYKVKLFPNPVDETLGIITGSNEASEIEVYDLYGRQLLRTSHPGGHEMILAVGGLKAGVYLILIRQGNYNFTGRFIRK